MASASFTRKNITEDGWMLLATKGNAIFGAMLPSLLQGLFWLCHGTMGIRWGNTCFPLQCFGHQRRPELNFSGFSVHPDNLGVF